MSRKLPSYERLMRWSVNDVTNWLQEVKLTEFTHQFLLGNIDGRRLANLTEFDINNFIGKAKFKQELTSYVLDIKKPKSNKSKPSKDFITDTKNKTPTRIIQANDDDSDSDSIYSNASSDEEYIYPSAKKDAPPTRRAPPIPSPTNKRFDDLRSSSSPTGDKSKKLPKETSQNQPSKRERPPMPIPVNNTDSKPTSHRRTPPPIPQPENESEYANATIIQNDLKRKNKEIVDIKPNEESDDEEETPISPISKRPSLPPVPIAARKRSTHKMEPIEAFSWYYGEMDRRRADEMLKMEGHNGMFVVRKSLKGGTAHPYTLMTYFESRTYNFPISQRESDKKFALGKENSQRQNQLFFSSVDELITHFKQNPVINNPILDGKCTGILTKPLPKI